MKEETIQTLHPLEKSNKKINKQKYDVIKEVIISVLKEKELTHTELFEKLNMRLKGKFEGNINWYGETVKLDLEARELIKRTNDKPQKYKVI